MPFLMPKAKGHRRGQFVVAECDCGTLAIVQVGNMTKGTSKSCGCLNRQKCRERATRHGWCGTRIYRTWRSMKDRCSNERSKSWADYGARGITVCEEWLDFDAFLSWALDHGYRDDLTIERRNNDVGYCPSNCCFIPKQEQNNNRRPNINVSAFGEVKNIAAWMRDERCVVSRHTLKKRIENGWDAEAAITKALR